MPRQQLSGERVHWATVHRTLAALDMGRRAVDLENRGSGNESKIYTKRNRLRSRKGQQRRDRGPYLETAVYNGRVNYLVMHGHRQNIAYYPRSRRIILEDPYEQREILNQDPEQFINRAVRMQRHFEEVTLPTLYQGTQSDENEQESIGQTIPERGDPGPRTQAYRGEASTSRDRDTENHQTSLDIARNDIAILRQQATTNTPWVATAAINAGLAIIFYRHLGRVMGVDPMPIVRRARRDNDIRDVLEEMWEKFKDVV